MSITLSDETERLIKDRMRETGATADQLIRAALEALDQGQPADYEELDEETRASIEIGLAQADRGEGIPVEEAREILRRRLPDRTE